MTCRPETTPQDLAVLRDFLDARGVRFWVHGGWAIDALTDTARPHKDIDLLVEEKHRRPLRAEFAGKIIAEMSHKFEVDFGGAEVDLVFFRKAWNGRLLTVTPRILVEWPRASLGDRTATVGGVTIPVVEPAVLYIEVTDLTGKKQEMIDKNKRDLERVLPLMTDQERREAARYYPTRNTFLNRVKLALGMG